MLLADYFNDSYFTQKNMGEALRYLDDLCAANPDSTASLAVRAAVGVVLNTAIATHKAELGALRSAKPDPLTDTLGDMMREIARSELASMEDRTKELATDCIESWMEDNLESKMGNWYEEQIDVEDEIEKYLRRRATLGITPSA